MCAVQMDFKHMYWCKSYLSLDDYAREAPHTGMNESEKNGNRVVHVQSGLDGGPSIRLMDWVPSFAVLIALHHEL